MRESPSILLPTFPWELHKTLIAVRYQETVDDRCEQLTLLSRMLAIAPPFVTLRSPVPDFPNRDRP
jgi:hypothetical protein